MASWNADSDAMTIIIMSWQIFKVLFEFSERSGSESLPEHHTNHQWSCLSHLSKIEIDQNNFLPDLSSYKLSLVKHQIIRGRKCWQQQILENLDTDLCNF